MDSGWDAITDQINGACIQTFGVQIVYMPQAGASYPISGVFDDAFQKDVLFDDGTAGVTTVTAVLGIQRSQFRADPAQNDQLYVPSTNATYVVREPRMDGHGGGKLLLNKTGPR
jgi:hypothetical protein